jgi:uncharacterized protein YbjT (DUF2867 family)
MNIGKNHMNQKVVTVVGATGALGSKIVKALIDQNHHVRAMVRATSNRTKLQELGVTDFVIGDMMDPQSLPQALSKDPKSQAIVASAAGYTRHTRGDNSKTDAQGYRNLIDATKSAGIPRFVLISILECDKAVKVPHFYNKYLAEKYLQEKGQSFIALRAGAFLDQTRDFVLPGIQKGVFPTFVPGVSYGMIYTPDLARYAALAATSLPESELNASVDVGWDRPASGTVVAEAFSKVLGRKIVAKPAFPPFVSDVIFPLVGLAVGGINDMHEMIKWIKNGDYTSKNIQRQRELFGDLPTVEEAVRRYCKDRKLV